MRAEFGTEDGKMERKKSGDAGSGWVMNLWAFGLRPLVLGLYVFALEFLFMGGLWFLLRRAQCSWCPRDHA